MVHKQFMINCTLTGSEVVDHRILAELLWLRREEAAIALLLDRVVEQYLEWSYVLQQLSTELKVMSYLLVIEGHVLAQLAVQESRADAFICAKSLDLRGVSVASGVPSRNLCACESWKSRLCSIIVNNFIKLVASLTFALACVLVHACHHAHDRVRLTWVSAGLVKALKSSPFYTEIHPNTHTLTQLSPSHLDSLAQQISGFSAHSLMSTQSMTTLVLLSWTRR